MINVLYVIWSLGLGGAEQVVINLARGLDKEQFQPFICCLNDEGLFADEAKAAGIKVFAVNKRPGLDFSVVQKIVNIIKENDIQVVHTHLWGANFWGRFAANAAKVPVAVTEHNVDTWKSLFHFMIDRYLFGKTACFIAVSETVREFYAAKLGVPREKMKVVYNGIEVRDDGRWTMDDGQKQLKTEFGIEENEKTISIIGRLVPQKGIDFFLETFRKMIRDIGNREDRGEKSRLDIIKVLIVGEGPERGALEEHVASSGLKDRVVFTGFRKDVRDILGITDVLVLPSTREGLPMILLEAMSAGAVIVATRVGGTPELVQDGVNGFLFESGSANGLREKLSYALDPQMTARIRESALKTVEEKFSLRKMLEGHERIYKELAAGFMSRAAGHRPGGN